MVKSFDRSGTEVWYVRAFLAAALAWLPTANASQQIQGKVVGISDGDTITILDSSRTQHRVRLHQIDAPEKRQDFGEASKQSLSDLVFDKQVTVEVVDRDRYRREVGTVWVEGMDANLEQIKRGLAWAYRRYARDPAYRAAEERARSARRGLWSQPNPIPPWEFRHKRK
ncbi:thermonuclease family protein [Methylocaldum sp. BRCS4]|uniref:thermonuclease family protein n=1 Tax=Methylocaldum sp. GT1BW TaxID=3438964 RepID=UPI0012EB9449|nr:thermonuclease family protein [Methylocaldum sp. BRCS4]